MTFIYLQSLLFQLVPVFGWKPLPRRVYYEYCYFNLSSAYSVLSSMINFVTPVIIASFPPELHNVLRRNHESCGRILQKLAGEIERLNTRLDSKQREGKFQWQNQEALKTQQGLVQSERAPIHLPQNKNPSNLCNHNMMPSSSKITTTEHSRGQDNVSDRSLVRGLLATSCISEHHVQ